MRKILLPAILLVNKLTFPQKLILFGVIVLLPVIFHTSSSLRNISNEMEKINNEIEGVNYATELNSLLTLAFEYRNLEFKYANGTKNLKKRLFEIRNSIDVKITILKTNELVFNNDLISKKSNNLFLQWQVLKNENMSAFKPNIVWVKHTSFITRIALLSKYIVDRTILTLDPDPVIHQKAYAFSSEIYDILDIINQYSFMDKTIKLDISIKENLKSLLEKKKGMLFRKNLIFIILLSITIVLIIYLFLGFYTAITESLFKLNNALSNVSNGDLNTLLEIKTNDELALVASFFNNMVGQLKDSKNKIEFHTQELKLQATALEKAANGILISDKNKNIVWANSTVCEMTGYSLKELIGVNDSIFSPYNSFSMNENEMEHSLKKNRVWKGELQRKRKDGSIYDEEVAITAVSLNNNGVNYYVSVKQDVTDRKLMEQALTNSEARFKSAFENAAVGQILIELNGSINNVNRVACKMFGSSKKELIGSLFTDLIYEDDKVNSFDHYSKLVLGDHPNYYLEKRFVHSGKEVFWGQLSLSTIQDKNGKIIFIVAQLQDITVSKWTENALISEKRKAQMYFEVAGVILVILDNNGNITLVNNKCREVLGYESKELIGQNFYSKCFPLNFAKKMQNLYEEVIKTNKESDKRIESTVITKTGEKRIIVWNYAFIKDGNSNIIGVINSGEDITDRKASELALRKSQSNLTTAQQLAQIGSWELNIKTKKMVWSDQLYRIFDLSPKNFLPSFESFIDRIHPRNQYQVKEIFRNAIEKKEEFEFTYSIILENGESRIITTQGKLGGVRQNSILGTAQDITERKLLERKIWDQERKLKQKLEREVKERTIELEKEKTKIQQINNDIFSSITYAKRIQTALLPQKQEIKGYLPNSFIYFKPKELVSGDFYWAGKENDKIIIAAVDCTGHGIPGALMHMIGNSLLDEIIYQRKNTVSHLILNELHKGIRTALKQDVTDNRDGMDLSICVIDLKTKTIQFSGAKNPLVFIQNNRMDYIKGDRNSIGGEQREVQRVFKSHCIKISSPTTLYIYTDGFQDQFGGDYGKKFMSKNFRKYLFELSKEPINKQEMLLEEKIISWMGNHHNQIDDILVMGFEIS